MIIKISKQLKALGRFMEDETSGAGTRVVAVANQRKFWEMVYKCATTDKPLIAICFNGETARGGFSQRNTLKRVDREWLIAVIQGSGFKHSGNHPEEAGVPTGGGIDFDTQFIDDCEAVRQLCCRCIGISEEPIDYASMKPIPGLAQPNMANVYLDGYVITFTTANDIPAITTVAPGQE